MASLRGLQLRRWRYGAETERLVAEALEREHWDPEQWSRWKDEMLARVLHRAATRVPFYREQWVKRRREGDKASWDKLENWPLLEKETLRQHASAFVAEDCNKRAMFNDHTSGTTGKSIDLWLSKSAVRNWYALFEARCRSWYGVSRDDRWAMLGGQLIVSVGQRKPPFWVWNRGLNQLYMSSYHLAPDLITYYFDALQRYEIKYMLGYSSSLYELAQEMLRLKRRDIRMKVVISNAEPLFDYQRSVIEEAFQCPLRETYGMAETVAAASECEHGQMHLWPEAGIVETLGDNDELTLGTSGELVCTGLINPDMPLVRYRVGDRGEMTASDASCECGRTLPILSAIEGRMDDTLYTTDGRRIGRLDTVFKSQLPIREAQIIQDARDCVRVRYVPSENWNNGAPAMLTERLKSFMGDVRVVLELVDQVPRGANGKFRAVVCNLPKEQRESLNLKVN